MVETIAPVVYGNKRRYLTAVALHTLFATLAASVLGLVLGAVGAVSGAPWGRTGSAVVLIVAVVYSLLELAGLPVPLFDRRKQVPEWWRTFYPRYVAASLYGAGLGIGYLTFLSHGTFVVVSALAVAAGDPLLGALVVGPFGLARGLSVLVSARTRDEQGPSELVAKLGRPARIRAIKALNGLVCAVIAALTAIPWPPSIVG